MKTARKNFKNIFGFSDSWNGQHSTNPHLLNIFDLLIFYLVALVMALLNK